MSMVYVAVTQDKYQLPIFIADTGRELSRMLGLSPDSVVAYITRYKRLKGYKKYPKYIRVEVDDDDVRR